MIFMTILAILTWDGRTLPSTETLYLCGQLCIYVDNPVSVWTALYLCEQPCIYVDNPVSMWTALYLCGQLCIFVNSPVSMWTILFLCGQLPFLSIGQNRFCVDSSVSVYTQGSI